VNGFSIKSNTNQALQQIGYCPQFDGLLDELTGREILTFYSRLRGIQENDIIFLVEDMSKLLCFDMHIDKLVAKYSGGTKRKLSTAVVSV
jgi:ATP-binding cassette, subfamily A (ABC1), member 3